MKPTVYIETTIIGYLAMRMSGALRTAANQQITRDWWDNHRHKYEPLISRYVVEECSNGDPTAVHWQMRYCLMSRCLRKRRLMHSTFPSLRSTA